MSEGFDPYYQWLGIPSDQQPPDHYRLLGLVPFEADVQVIRAAVEQRFAYLRTFQLSKQAELAERLLNEVAAAKTMLLNPEKKGSYDAWLRTQWPVPPPLPAQAPPSSVDDSRVQLSRRWPRQTWGFLKQKRWFLAAVALLLVAASLSLWALLRPGSATSPGSPTASEPYPEGWTVTRPPAPTGEATAEASPTANASAGGVVRLVVVPSGALVRADQKPGKVCFRLTAGDSEVPLWLPLGTYQLHVEKAGYVSAVQEIAVAAVGEQTVMVQLTPLLQESPAAPTPEPVSPPELPPSAAGAPPEKNPFQPAHAAPAAKPPEGARASRSATPSLATPPVAEAKSGCPEAVAVCTLAAGKPVTALTFCPGQAGQTLLAGDQEATLWDLTSGERITTFHGPPGKATAQTFTANGQQLLSTSEDLTAILWNIHTAEQVRSFSGRAVLSPDGAAVLTINGSHALTWDVSSGTHGADFSLPPANASAVAFRHDHLLLLTGQTNGVMVLRVATTGRPLRIVQGHRAAVTAVVFSPDGQQLATGSADQTVCLWSSDKLERSSRFQGHYGSITALAYSPDGRQLLSGSGDHTAILWDASSGQPRQICRGHQGPITAVAFSSDGRQFLTGSLDGKAMLWNVPEGSATNKSAPE